MDVDFYFGPGSQYSYLAASQLEAVAARTAAASLEKIHSLRVAPGELSADFGAAPAQAFWALLTVIERQSARPLRITSIRSDDPPC